MVDGFSKDEGVRMKDEPERWKIDWVMDQSEREGPIPILARASDSLAQLSACLARPSVPLQIEGQPHRRAGAVPSSFILPPSSFEIIRPDSSGRSPTRIASRCRSDPPRLPRR